MRTLRPGQRTCGLVLRLRLRMTKSRHAQDASTKVTLYLYSPYLLSQAEVELRAACESEAATRAAAKARSAAEVADALAGGEAEAARQRAWDDWKDDNPRGAGNSKLRPTA